VPSDVSTATVSVKDVQKILDITRRKDWSSERIGRPASIGIVVIHFLELESNGNTFHADKWFPLKIFEEESELQDITSTLSTSPQSPSSPFMETGVNNTNQSIGSPSNIQNSSLNIKQELQILEERLEYEAQKMNKKIIKLQKLNSEIRNLNASKEKIKEELQQLQKIFFEKALKNKSAQFELERKFSNHQKEDISEKNNRNHSIKEVA